MSRPQMPVLKCPSSNVVSSNARPQMSCPQVSVLKRLSSSVASSNARPQLSQRHFEMVIFVNHLLILTREGLVWSAVYFRVFLSSEQIA